MISIIIPCHNLAKYLRAAADSVLVQTRGDHELIIVNDCSPDDTQEIAEAIVEENPGRAVQVIRTEENVGLSAARNLGISQSCGEYILPLDADDFLHPMCLKLMAGPLDRGEADIVSAAQMNFGATCRTVDLGTPDPNLLPVYNGLGYCSMYRKTCWEAAGGYPVNYPRMGREDWEFWIRCARHGFRFGHVPEILWHYRDRPDSMAKAAMDDDEFLMARIVTRNPQLYARESIERAYAIIEEETHDEDSSG